MIEKCTSFTVKLRWCKTITIYFCKQKFPAEHYYTFFYSKLLIQHRRYHVSFDLLLCWIGHLDLTCIFHTQRFHTKHNTSLHSNKTVYRAFSTLGASMQDSVLNVRVCGVSCMEAPSVGNAR